MPPDPTRLVSLEQFRREKPSTPGPNSHPISQSNPPTPTVVEGAKAWEPTVHPRTRRRVAAALGAVDRLKRQELAAVAACGHPKSHRVRFSAAGVAREAKVGRTQLYEGSPIVRDAVAAARAEIEAALEACCDERRPASKHSLEARIAALKVRHEAEIKRLASQQMSDLIRRMGPQIEAVQRFGNQIAALQERVRQLEDQLAAQVSANNILRAALERLSEIDR